MLLTIAIIVAFVVVPLIGFWKVFTKAGLPGWGAFVPIYNLYLFYKMAGKPGWFVLLSIVPLVNAIVYLLALHDVSRNFGKGVGFTVGLAFLPFVFWMILGFGAAEYTMATEPKHRTSGAA